MNTTITASNGYRPYKISINGITRFADKIRLFATEKEHIISHGWLEETTINGEKTIREKDIKEIVIPGIRLKRKFDKEADYSQWTKEESGDSWDSGKKYFLSIPCEKLTVLEKISLETDTETSYINVIIATICGKEYTIRGSYLTRQVKTVFGEKVAETRKMFEEEGIKIGSYEMEKILKEFDITRRV